MPHSCRICGRMRPNEKFSGKGHRSHICKDCQKMPKEERDAIDQYREIYGYLKQSHISSKNLIRLRQLASSANQQTALMAQVALDVAQIKPHRRGRLKHIAAVNRELLGKLEDTGLIQAHG